MTDSTGRMLPSALIPFCIYQNDDTPFGQAINKLSMTTCVDFQPIVLDGQLCYSLNMSKSGTKETKSGQNNGLLLYIDPTNLQIENKEESPFRIFIHTLSPQTLGGSGLYALNSLKRMTGTESFLDLPEHKKECQLDSTEDCLAEKLLAEIKRNCFCIPWHLTRSSKDKVIMFLFFIFNLIRRDTHTVDWTKSPV